MFGIVVISRKHVGWAFTGLGSLGAIITAILSYTYAPGVDPEAWNAPEAYRILFWHVPFAWTSFVSYTILFIGSIAWYARRKEWGWRLVATGSDLGLLFGLGVVISGPIWGAAEWGVPWDWGDLRLNTYALLTSVALFIVLSRRSQPDGINTRDTLSTVGLFGFALVPITALATTLYRERHPGVVIIKSEDSGLDPEISRVLLIGVLSFSLLMIGLSILTELSYRLHAELVELQQRLDEVVH